MALPDLELTMPRKRPAPRILTVKHKTRLTPNMIRVTFAGPEIATIRASCEGAHCKLMLPAANQTREAFASQLEAGPRPATRTYTVRHLRQNASEPEMDIDFVDHGDNGPASAWALSVKPGDFCGFGGPGPIKVEEFHADWYLVAADMSALPMAAATLEAMPRDARGLAIFEITEPDDKQDIAAPEGIDIRWLLHPVSHRASAAQVDLVTALDWPEGVVQTCIAGESGVIRTLRDHLANQREVPRKDTYISGYWKIGLVEDEHQAMKRREG
jgi:NADPH-dependent ferric siderophore reductase